MVLERAGLCLDGIVEAVSGGFDKSAFHHFLLKPLDEVNKSRRNNTMIKINATLILTVLNFILLIGVLSTILWKPMMKFLDERAKKISDSFKLADENKKRAEELKIERDEIIKSARTKANEIADKAMKVASNESRELIAHAREQAKATIDSAREEIKMEAERIKQDLRKEVASMTVNLASMVLEREIKDDDHKKFINKSLDILDS